MDPYLPLAPIVLAAVPVQNQGGTALVDDLWASWDYSDGESD